MSCDLATFLLNTYSTHSGDNVIAVFYLIALSAFTPSLSLENVTFLYAGAEYLTGNI